ncbi:hypothetical protein CRUP_024358 [Coryphaenoides rupestris]|nr:hypothetical protein CRUP_024358 [Coryphaenoides rupestris]
MPLSALLFVRGHREDTLEDLPSQMPTASKIPKGVRQPKAPATPAQPSGAASQSPGLGASQSQQQRQRQAAAAAVEGSDGQEAGARRTPQAEQQDAEFASLKATWEMAKFRLRLLEGHTDIVTCVVAIDNVVISGSFYAPNC